MALVLLGAGTAWAVGAADAQERDDSRRDVAEIVLSRFENRAEALVRSLQADPVTTPPMEPLAGAIEAILLVPTGDDPVRPVYRLLAPGRDAAEVVATSGQARDLARDTGKPQAAAPRDGAVLIAVPLYRGGSAPDSTTARRLDVVAWRLAVVHPERLLAGLVLPDGATADLTIDATRAADPDASVTAVVAGQPWELALDLPTSSPLSRGALAVAALALVGAVLLVTTGTVARRTVARERAATAVLERETRTVAELGPLLQSSLDLAEVLPAAAVRLSDEFGLSRLAVQLHGDHGRLVDVFALGSGTGADSDEVVVTPSTTYVPAGVPASLPLQRAGRTIGRLTLTARRPLQQAQVAALSAAADLIAVATYNVELYEREQGSVRRLRELDQLKDAFLGTISHELRTPITAIGGFVRLLLDRWTQVSDEQRRELLERVQRNSLSLGLLVDDLLDFARLERQALNAPASPMQLDRQVADVVAQLAPILDGREVVLELEPVVALANASALERVLANLLTNADKFSPADGRIVVRLTSRAGTATLDVIDEGPGIPAEDREHVFDRFYRGNSDAARGTRGAGIGLSVVRELVKQMGGSVRALPSSPHGTRMSVSLATASTTGSPPDLPRQEHRSDSEPSAVIERSGT